MESTSNQQIFERISKNFTLITLLCFLLGYTYKNSYYNEFQISILNYLSTTEVFYTLLPLAGVFLGFFYFIGTWQSIYDGDDSKLEKDKTGQVSKTRQILILFLRFAVFIAAIITIQVVLPNRFGQGYKEQPLVSIIGLVITYYYLLNDTILKLLKGFNLPLNQISILLLVLFIAFLNYGVDGAKVMKRWGNDTKYSIKIKSEVIKTNDSLFIIGETQSSLFLYSKKNSATRIIKRDQIDSLVVNKR